jgi:DNA segregation ATPase FtsK/SpoIIIE, S-DNA-T family
MAKKTKQSTGANSPKGGNKQKSAKQKADPKINVLKTIVAFLRDEKMKYALGILLMLVSLYMILSFISYFFHWETDQDFRWAQVFSGPEILVNNQGGKLGAWMSDLFINQWFGFSSLLFPFILIVWALNLYKIKLLKPWRTTRNSLILIILFSVTLGLIFGSSNGYLGSGPGGAHGYHLSRWLIASIGGIGTSFILIILYAVFFLFGTAMLPWVIDIRAKRNAQRGDLDTDHSDDPKDNDENSDSGDMPDTNEREMDPYPEEVKSDDSEGELDPFLKPDKEIEQSEDQAETEKSESDSEEGNGVIMTVTDPSREEKVDGTETAELKDYDPTLDLPKYQLPPLKLLIDYNADDDSTVTNEELLSNKNRIVETLASYKIKIDKIKATIGPAVTLYEIVPAPGIRISKIKNLEDDIALSLSALGIRIIAPIPGKGTIGIEVPNLQPKIVSMKTILGSKKFQESDFELTVALGKTISNETFTFDLTKMPHLLVAGATGQGKSVGLNAIIASLLYKKHPAQLKFVMVDPKKVELSLFSKIERHFLAKLADTEDPIITDTQKVISTLNSLCAEMDERYDLLQNAHVRNIKEYNKKFIARKLSPEKGHRYMPFIVVIIDEFADLIMTAGRDVEHPISRLAQLARAIGIHLVIATQRPTTNIITGVIKANFPARIAFRVFSGIDSRTILDGPGADQLVGRGDMLFLSGNEPIRLQCAFIDTPEIDSIVDFIGEQRGYPTALELKPVEDESGEAAAEVDLNKRDDKFEEAARLVVAHNQGSTSMIQRRLSLGYNRAGRIVDQLEAAGILGPFEGSKARQVLVKDDFSLEQILKGLE